MFKKRLETMICVLVLMVGLTSVGQAQLPSPVGWWKFDGDAIDSSGNGYDGTIDGDITYVAGYHDQCVSINDASARIELPPEVWNNLAGDTFSFCCWTYRDAGQITVDSTMFDVGGRQFQAHVPWNNSTIYWYNEGGMGTRMSTTWDSTWTGQWIHVAFVNGDGYRRLYVNGVQVLEGASSGTLVQTATNFTLGNGSTGQNRGHLGLIDDARMYNDILTVEDIQGIIAGADLVQGPAVNPSPSDGATDVLRDDTTLTWGPGKFSAGHRVYFGSSFEEVDSATEASDAYRGEKALDDTSFATGRLEFDATYFWRIDEVNDLHPDKIWKGNVWQFEVEPFGYPIESLTATASSFQAGAGPENTINGSGLDASDQHGTLPETIWMTTGIGANWILYEFDKVYKLYELWVWNANQTIEKYLGFGARDVTIEYSSDGLTWAQLENVPEFARAPGEVGYAANTIVDLGGVLAQYVKLTINANWAGGIPPQTGLSEVRFVYVPVQAREPQPADGATGVSIDTSLAWRPGREAVSHEVFFDTDRNAVAVGSALVDTVIERSYDPGLLDLGTMYYWKINEVGDAGTYEGDLWSFTAQEYISIDDFESYSPDDFETGDAIWEVWIDGLTNMTGSIVGYFDAPYQEQTIVHGGDQSMPLDFNNVFSPFYSEAELPLSPAQDWTVQGTDTLSLWLRGQPVSFLETADGITMSAAGADIYNQTDEFRYAYKPLNGDGSITVRVDSVDNLNTWTKAGVMIRESLVPAVKSVHMIVAPSGRVEFQYRELAATNTVQPALDVDTVTLPCWVRLTRTGNDFVGEYSTDGTTWQTIDVAAGTSSTTLEMASSVYIGLAVTSHVADESVVAEFSNVSTSAGITGPWQVAEIGVDHPGNDPGDVYVAVQDSSNNVATVTYPGGANLMDWTEWRIPLTDLAGVNPTKVKTLYIGVGDRDNPTPGGAGRVFVDDIGYGRPAADE